MTAPAELGWAGPGPVLPSDVEFEVRAVLDELVATFGLNLPVVTDHASAIAAIQVAGAAVDALLPRAEPAHAVVLARLCRALHRADLQLQRLHAERVASTTAILTRVLPRLEAATCSVSELVAVTPELICELGFDRGLISRVTDGIWYPELMYIMGDPDWAARVTEAGKSEPLELVPGLYETELVLTRRAILVNRVHDPADPRWGHPGMVESSLTHSYVAAPIMSEGQVVGILHGDRYGQRRDVDEVDRDLLAAFAEAFRLVLSRAALNDRLQETQSQLGRLTVALDEASGAVHQMPLVRIDRQAGEQTEGMVIRVGPRAAGARPLPDNLTSREMEVLALLAAGRTNIAIARQLVIAEGTAKQHVKHILRKLDVGNRSEAVARWFQAGGTADPSGPGPVTSPSERSL
jgi:DNA-binding CsgD family transcriptional regulator/GAF domain-containing protein